MKTRESFTLIPVYCRTNLDGFERKQREANTREAVAIGRDVRAAGHTPIVPHVAVEPLVALVWPTERYNAAMRMCLDLVRVSDAVLRLDNTSPGAEREVAEARGIVIRQAGAGWAWACVRCSSGSAVAVESLVGTLRAAAEHVDEGCLPCEQDIGGHPYRGPHGQMVVHAQSCAADGYTRIGGFRCTCGGSNP